MVAAIVEGGDELTLSSWSELMGPSEGYDQLSALVNAVHDDSFDDVYERLGEFSAYSEQFAQPCDIQW